MYEVYLRDRVKPLTFGGLCNHVDYSDLIKMCIFSNESKDGKLGRMLAAVPISNIAYIANMPYKSAGETIKEEVKK